MINVGDKAPEILGINEKGEEIRLSAYKGKKFSDNWKNMHGSVYGRYKQSA